MSSKFNMISAKTEPVTKSRMHMMKQLIVRNHLTWTLRMKRSWVREHGKDGPDLQRGLGAAQTMSWSG
jgi:hypothetical protein